MIKRHPYIKLTNTELKVIASEFLLRRKCVVSTEFHNEDITGIRQMPLKFKGQIFIIEIKRYYSDFLAEFKKRKWHTYEQDLALIKDAEINDYYRDKIFPPNYHYFMCQYDLATKILNSNLLPINSGLISVPLLHSINDYRILMGRPDNHVSVVKKAKLVDRPFACELTIDRMNYRNMWDAHARRRDTAKLKRFN